MKLTDTAATVLRERYLKRDKNGHVCESPLEMFIRVANHVAAAETEYCRCIQVDDRGCEHEYNAYKDFRDVMMNLDFLPNSPCLANAGKNNLSLSACYVLPVEDSIEGIFEAVKNAALIHQTGGGTGFSFSRLRPTGSFVSTTGHAASGPVTFLRVFDAATDAIKQGGMRRGANMGVLRCDHPDILEFIHCKDDGTSITNFNISVLISDLFMEALHKGADYFLVNPQDGGIIGNADAKAVWNAICESAWRTGDPGVIFIDRVNDSHANPIIGWEVEATNPCGEQPLYPYDSCNLGSINLGNFVDKDTRNIDYQRLRKVVHIAVRFLDDVITVNNYAVPEIRSVTDSIRRIGLGVMGWADMLIQWGTPYDSEEAVNLAYRLSSFISEEADIASRILAEERGAFPLYEKSIYAKDDRPIRNSTRTTIAPTGTISLIAGCSSGIEPLFALSYEHHGLEGKLDHIQIISPHVEVRMAISGMDASADPVLRTAHEIDPIWHIRHQAAWQSNVDNAVSKTINLPEEATVEEVSKAYHLAWDLGCMGVTVYRNNCRKGGQVLNATGDVEGGPERKTEVDVSTSYEQGYGRDNRLRPTVLPGFTYRQPTPFGNMYVTISEDEGEPYEVFVTIGKAGSDVQAMAEALGRVSSKHLQYARLGERRIQLHYVGEQLRGIGGSSSNGFGIEKVRSLPDAIARVVERYLEGGSNDELSARSTDRLSDHGTSLYSQPFSIGEVCVDCGQLSVYLASGCPTCQNCGWSRC